MGLVVFFLKKKVPAPLLRAADVFLATVPSSHWSNNSCNAGGHSLASPELQRVLGGLLLGLVHLADSPQEVCSCTHLGAVLPSGGAAGGGQQEMRGIGDGMKEINWIISETLQEPKLSTMVAEHVPDRFKSGNTLNGESCPGDFWQQEDGFCSTQKLAVMAYIQCPHC